MWHAELTPKDLLEIGALIAIAVTILSALLVGGMAVWALERRSLVQARPRGASPTLGQA